MNALYHSLPAEQAQAEAQAVRYHEDCANCCAIGRCHFCLVQPAVGALQATLNNYTYAACRNHWQRLIDTFGALQAAQGANTPQP